MAPRPAPAPSLPRRIPRLLPLALTLAFLANDTWSAHDRAMNAVYREADSLRSIAALSGTLAQPVQGQIRAHLADYALAIVDDYVVRRYGTG